MSVKLRKWILAAIVVSPAVAWAAMQGTQGGDSIEIVPQSIAGVVYYSDGETPAYRIPVRIWNVDRQKMVYKTETDRDGIFQIPRIGVGRSLVFVGGVKIDLQVLIPEDAGMAQHHDIVVVIPRRILLGHKPELTDIIIGTTIVPPFVVVSP